jgi:two-component system sensor histidine kinase YesM
MKKEKHSFYKDEIRRTLLFYAIIPVLLVTLVCLLISWLAIRYSIEQTNQNDNRTMSAQMEEITDSYIDLISMLEKQDQMIEGNLDVETRVSIFEQIYEVSNRLDKKATVYVFREDFTPIITGTETIPEFLDGRYAGNWGIFRAMNQNPDRVAIKLIKKNDTADMQMVIGKALLREGEIRGYATFVIDSRQFNTDISNLSSQIVITDEYGWVYVSNSYNFYDTLDRFNLKIDKSHITVKNHGRKFFISSNDILNRQLHVYTISSMDYQIKRIQYIAAVLVLVFAMMIIAVLISSKRIAAKKTRDLYAIIKAFENVKKGDLDTHVDVSGNDDFEIIAEAYNQMLGSLKENIRKNKEMSKLVAFSQLKQLESQFNPHFLFNTLENIRVMCKLDPPAAGKMVLNLSTLLRYSISNKQEEVTVVEDVAYTENYMSILKYRFNQRFQYTIDISPEIEQCIIPKLLIQPMIENSIKYGFEGKEQLLVEVNGYREDNRLIMICADNGAGISPEVLEEIQQSLKSSTNRSSHSGLYNVNRRLQLKYGEEFGIHIDSVYGNGTTLKIILPIRREESSGDQCAENINS